jgi:hypothetical protein
MKIFVAWVGTIALVACGGGGHNATPEFAERPAGCQVEVYRDAPTVPTTNIGPVRASCDATLVKEDDCMRELLDQVCKLGGDAVWQVSDKPTLQDGKQIFTGRAAKKK